MSEHALAPIAVFAYKRPNHLKRLLDSLEANSLLTQSPVYAYCDGAKRPEDHTDVRAARDIIRAKLGGYATIVERDSNRGLANSIIAGVTELTEKYGRVIVLEDDLILSRDFLSYMNAALDRYADEERVFHVSGFRYPVGPAVRPQFFRLTCSWGWATWARAWKYFEPDPAKLERLIAERKLRRAFDIDGKYYFNRMLKMQTEGKIDSWAIRWYASAFLNGGLALYPSASQVINEGFDGSGTHCNKKDAEETVVSIDIASREWPSVMQEDPAFTAQARKYFGSTAPTLMHRIKRRLKHTFSLSA